MKKDINNKMIFGVCSGLSREFKIDTTITRTLFVISSIMGFGTPILVYLVLACLMPID